MIGFVPGYAYLGGLDPTIATPRRESAAGAGARRARSRSAASRPWWPPSRRRAAGISSGARRCAPSCRTGTRSSSFEAGDRVQFEPIDASRWDALDRAAAAGEPVAEVVAMTELVVKACGPRTSLQDRGRIGSQRYGVSNSGAMDRLALAAANVLVGNAAGRGGDRVHAARRHASRRRAAPVRVAVAGAPCAVALDGQPVPSSTTLVVAPGQTLTVGPMRIGVYAYLAVAGGFDLAPQLGSLSLHQRAALGGFHGRAFAAGDRVPLRAAKAPDDGPLLRLPQVPVAADAAIRVVIGPAGRLLHAGRPRHASLRRLRGYRRRPTGWAIAWRGRAIEHAKGFNIVSDGIVSGSVQVPGSGEPIVMMADRQTTGGYPKIATVISADLRVARPAPPGRPVAVRARRRWRRPSVSRASRAAEIAALPTLARPVAGGLPSPEELLGLNLAGAAVDALSGDS